MLRKDLYLNHITGLKISRYNHFTTLRTQIMIYNWFKFTKILLTLIYPKISKRSKNYFKKKYKMVKIGFRKRFNKHYPLTIIILITRLSIDWMLQKTLILRLIKTELMYIITPVPLFIPRTISRSCQCHKILQTLRDSSAHRTKKNGLEKYSIGFGILHITH